MSQDDKKFGKYIWGAIGLVYGLGMGLFMARKEGKKLRQEIYDRWEAGESLPVAKWKVFAREALHAFKSFPDMLDEFLENDKVKSTVKEYKDKGKELTEKGKKMLDETMEEGMDYFDKKVKEGKKILDKKMMDGKKEVKKVVKKVQKKIKK